MNPVIFLWAHPRSMSTAIERIMRERGDFDCLHEPFLHFYYHQRAGKSLPHFKDQQQFPDSYAATRDMVLERAEKAPVFAKDMSYYVMPDILQDREFCQRVRHCFLIRDPVPAILSYYRLDSEVTLDEVGIEMQWRQFVGLRDMGLGDGIVLEAESVQRDPQTSMREFWRALNLDYRADALAWDAVAPPADWQYVEGWHQMVSASSGIRAADANETPDKQAEFEQLCQRVPRLADYLQHHQPYYQLLRQQIVPGRAHDGGSN